MTELGDVQARIIELQSILDSPEKLRGVIKSEMTAIKEEFATPRVCKIGFDAGEMSIEDLTDDKELVIVMTEAQYVKAVPAASFKTQGRGGRGVTGAKLKSDDIVRHVIFTTAHAYLLFFSNRGRVYRLRALEVPERERTAKGMPIVNLLPLQPGENIQAIIDTRDFAAERYLFFATRHGVVKKTSFDEYDNGRRDGLIALNLREHDELVRVIETSGTDDIFMVSKGGMTIRFNEGEVRPMGRAASGVRGMKLKPGDTVVSCDLAKDDTSILMITELGFGKRVQLDKFNVQGRGGQGVKGMKFVRNKGTVGGGRVHGGRRRRDRGRRIRRHHHPHAGARHPPHRSRCHGCHHHGCARRRSRRLRGAHPRHRRRRRVTHRRHQALTSRHRPPPCPIRQ